MKYQINIFYGEEDINNIFEEAILKEIEKGNCNLYNIIVSLSCTKISLQEGGKSV